MNKFKVNKKSEKIYRFVYRTDRHSYQDATMLVIARTPVEAVKKFNSKCSKQELVDVREFTEVNYKNTEE